VKNRSELFLFRNKKELEKLTINARPYALKRFGEKNAEKIVRSYLNV